MERVRKKSWRREEKFQGKDIEFTVYEENR